MDKANANGLSGLEKGASIDGITAAAPASRRVQFGTEADAASTCLVKVSEGIPPGHDFASMAQKS